MTGTNDKNKETLGVSEKKTLTLTRKTESKPAIEKDQVHQRFARGRSKTVEVEVRRKRTPGTERSNDHSSSNMGGARGQSSGEFDVRMKALKESMLRQNEEDAKREAEAQQAAVLRAQQKQDIESKIKTVPEEAVVAKASIQQTAQQNESPVVQEKQTEPTPQAKAPEAPRPETQRYGYSSDRNPSQQTGHRTPDRSIDRNGPLPARTGDKPRYGERSDSYRSGDSRNNSTDPRGARPVGPRTPDTKKPFSKDDIKPIVLRANGYGARPAPKGPQIQEPIVIDPILDKNRSDHRAVAVKPRKRPEDEDDKSLIGKIDPKKPIVKTKTSHGGDAPRKLNRNVISRVLDGDSETKGRSLASVRRARQKHYKQQHNDQGDATPIVREVIIPESITVGELANRMAVRGAEVVKSLMKLGMMVTINQVIDADTAELICGEFGHTPKRVADSDIEIGLGGQIDDVNDMMPRAPVVTVMGHVDHGKTSLLDALRATDVVSDEAGGITQHIGAYQVTMKSGKKITFIDTPGHAAFSEMRARGANATDIVILVVAADDGIMAQTIEAINHAKAANVPMVVAINKIDKPDSNPARVRQELLQHGILLEEFGGDVMAVEVSAKQKLNLEKLEEIVLLQSEVLELKANPNRSAQGVVVEAEIDKGRGTVATILVQKGTLNIGDIFVAGSEWGRVKALVNDHGHKIKSAAPSVPVEVLGFNGVPAAGDEFIVVENEQKAREIAEYRTNRIREKQTIIKTKGGMENIMSRIVSGDSRELPLVIKADVQGSLEAIMASVAKLATDEVSTRVLHGAVGGINESDITLAKASGGMIVGFNVRANPQARDLARRDGVEIRYYSIIYDVIDEVKALMGGLLAPTLREKYQGSAEIRDVFTISRVGGKVAGCYITDGMVKRGAKVRILRDSVVVHEGDLKSLKRFKDEVKEVKESYECGMVFENFEDIKVGDVIECFEIESIARQL